MTALALALAGWLGTALVLEQVRWFRTPPLRARVAPYLVDGPGTSERATPQRLRGAVHRADAATDRLAELLGGRRSLGERLRQAGVTTSAAEYRSRRVVLVTLVSTAATGAALVVQPGWTQGVVAVISTGCGLVVADELRLRTRRTERSRHLSAELPVVAEQLGMLLSAGFSLPAALQRIATRGSGVAAEGLAEVVRRVRQGESELAALEHWAARSGTDGAVRLVRVLSLHRQAGDLGLLISAEARAVRAEHHRRLLESISRRSQLVWVPVTVATLVPGLIVLAVPFASAVGQITGT